MTQLPTLIDRVCKYVIRINKVSSQCIAATSVLEQKFLFTDVRALVVAVQQSSSGLPC